MKVCDILGEHPSWSKQHAIIQYRLTALKNQSGIEKPKMSTKPYLIDLGSTNGSFINGVRIESSRYYELKSGDTLTFGGSKREFVFISERAV